MKVTQNELLDALRDALTKPSDGDGFTGPELARMMGCHAAAARDALRVLAAQGRLEVVTVHRAAIDGRTMTLRGYRLKAKGK